MPDESTMTQKTPPIASHAITEPVPPVTTANVVECKPLTTTASRKVGDTRAAGIARYLEGLTEPLGARDETLRDLLADREADKERIAKLTTERDELEQRFIQQQARSHNLYYGLLPRFGEQRMTPGE